MRIIYLIAQHCPEYIVTLYQGKIQKTSMFVLLLLSPIFSLGSYHFGRKVVGEYKTALCEKGTRRAHQSMSRAFVRKGQGTVRLGKCRTNATKCSIICLLWGFIEMYILQIGSQKFICKVSEAFVTKSHLRISPGPRQYSGAFVNFETVYLYLVQSGGFMFAFYGDLDKISMDKTGQCYCGNIRGGSGLMTFILHSAPDFTKLVNV